MAVWSSRVKRSFWIVPAAQSRGHLVARLDPLGIAIGDPISSGEWHGGLRAFASEAVIRQHVRFGMINERIAIEGSRRPSWHERWRANNALDGDFNSSFFLNFLNVFYIFNILCILNINIYYNV